MSLEHLAKNSEVSESGFISKVYLWMAAGLGLSGAASFWLLTQPALLKLIFTNNWVMFGLIGAELGLVLWLSIGFMGLSYVMAASIFLIYSILNGFTLTSVLLIYTGSSVMSTFAITAGTFLFFSVYGATTKKDLTSVGNLAMMALFGIIIASIVNFFWKNTAFELVISFIGVAVFIGLIAYDTQKLKAIYALGFEDASTQKKMAIMGALRLYLDFINLFLMLLRLFGRRRD